MPLIVLGLIVIIGIVLYALIKYENSDSGDDRTARERYPHAFAPKDKVHDIFESFEKAGEDDYDDSPADGSRDGNTIHFPDNAELEKRKRNIH